MKITISSIKNQLLKELWLKSVKKGGSLFYPTLKNKRMRILTLTNDTNFKEIPQFVEGKLTVKENIVVWNYSHIKKIRFETTPQIFPAIVLGSTRFEDSILGFNHPVMNHFPFDVLNLDFSSQDPRSYEGRMEKEMQGVEKAIEIQKRKGVQLGGFVLLYTTLINSKEISCENIIEKSDDIRIRGWPGLNLNDEPTRTCDQGGKIRISETVFRQFALKYGFNAELEKLNKQFSRRYSILSIAEILKS